MLQLGYNQLTGSIPPQLGKLNKLAVLALQSNQLTGAIPATLGDLTQLARLDLSFNSLFGSIPSKIAEVPLLEVFDVRNNSLSGSVPAGNIPFYLPFLSKTFAMFIFITVTCCLDARIEKTEWWVPVCEQQRSLWSWLQFA